MKITVSNFLAYSKPVEFDLRKTNLFIGGNNCGKSTFSKLVILLANMSEGYSEIDFSINLFEFQKFFPEILTFNDLLFHSENPISVSIEFSVFSKIVIFEFEFIQNESYQIDDYGINKGGAGYINSISVDNYQLLKRTKRSTKFYLLGFRRARQMFEELLDANEGGHDWSGVENLKQVINLLSNDWEKKFDVKGEYKFELIKDEAGFVDRYWRVEILKGFIDLLKERIGEFSLINPKTYIDSLHHYETKSVIDSIKEHFEAELIYKDIYQEFGRNNCERKVIRKEIFVSYKDREVPLKAMGLGFQNLYQILLTETSYSWSKHINEKGHFPIYQEPEIGLHPDWQVKLFKLIKRGIIETHSLIILRALQLEVAEGNFSSEDVMIHNFYRDKNDEIEVKQIRVMKSGILSDDFESGFQDELVQIEHKLWQIQQKLINRN